MDDANEASASTSARLAYSPEEVAEQLGVSRATIYRQLKEGTIPSVKIGACRRIFLADLQALRAA